MSIETDYEIGDEVYYLIDHENADITIGGPAKVHNIRVDVQCNNMIEIEYFFKNGDRANHASVSDDKGVLESYIEKVSGEPG